MVLSFVRVFEYLVFKRVFERLLQVFALFSRERYCEEDIFDDVAKIIDLPKVISHFLGQVARLDE